MKVSKQNKKAFKQLCKEKAEYTIVLNGVSYKVYEGLKVIADRLPPLQKAGERLNHYEQIKRIYNDAGGLDAGIAAVNEYSSVVVELVQKLIKEKNEPEITGKPATEKNSNKRPVRKTSTNRQKEKKLEKGGE